MSGRCHGLSRLHRLAVVGRLAPPAVVAVGACQFAAVVMAWEPPADTESATDPGWYGAGATPRVEPPGYGAGAALGAQSGATDWSGGSYWGADNGSPGDWSGSRAPRGGNDAPDGSQWPSQPGATGQSASGAAYWQGLADWYSPDTGGGASAPAASWYPRHPFSDYRFRGDEEVGSLWRTPGGWGNAQSRDRFQGYRFRSDERLNARRQQAVGDPMYRFRPLDEDGSSAEASQDSSVDAGPASLPWRDAGSSGGDFYPGAWR